MDIRGWPGNLGELSEYSPRNYQEENKNHGRIQGFSSQSKKSDKGYAAARR
jgi:hypothetical protein